MSIYKKILVISDTHFPYHHQDTFRFLEKLNKAYQPDCVVHIGDEMDWHSINVSHVINPDLPSPADELLAGQSLCHQLEKIFPSMWLLESNHGSMILRRAMAKGMSKWFIKDYNEILDVSNKWKWTEKLILESDKGKIVFAHQMTKDISKSVQQTAMSCVQGHYHCSSEIKYTSNDFHLNFGMTVGCLVDKKSLAMAYMKVNLAKPILSCGVITNGIPYLVPMVLKKNGSWDNNIYL